MRESNVEHEIKVVRNIIRILNDCLAISMKHKRKEECKTIMKDINNCEKELNRLIGISEAKKNEEIDAAVTKEKEKENEAV